MLQEYLLCKLRKREVDTEVHIFILNVNLGQMLAALNIGYTLLSRKGCMWGHIFLQASLSESRYEKVQLA